MKIKLSPIFLLLTATALTYTSCKKLNDGSSPAPDTKAVSTRVALNLSQTLYGGLGGFSVSQGLNAPGAVGVSREKLALRLNKGRALNGIGSDITCGLSVDTTLDYNTTLSDGSSGAVSGPIKFTFLCSNGAASGFNVSDNLLIYEATAQLTASYNLDENLTLQAINPGSSSSNISLGGTLSMSDNIQYKSGSKQTTTESYSYTFTSVIIDTNGVISGGSATFSTHGNDATGIWSYLGTVIFLGNNMVNITINGTSYTVNLQTGAVS
jgi:hypothetical protein